MFEQKSEKSDQNTSFGHRNFPLHSRYNLQKSVNPVPRQRKNVPEQKVITAEDYGSIRSSLKSVSSNSEKVAAESSYSTSSTSTQKQNFENSIPIKNNRSSQASSISVNYGVNKITNPTNKSSSINKIVNQATIQASTPISH